MGWRKITVQAHEQVVAQRDGAVVTVLGPGRHPKAWRTGYTRVDVREQLKLVAGQELLTTDGVTVKVSATVRGRSRRRSRTSRWRSTPKR